LETLSVKGLNAYPLLTAVPSKFAIACVTSGAVTSLASITTTAGEGEPGKALSIAAFACMAGRLLDMP
jgi:hypothetical protein